MSQIQYPFRQKLERCVEGSCASVAEGIFGKWEEFKDSILYLYQSKYFVCHLYEDESKYYSIFAKNSQLYVCHVCDGGKIWNVTFDVYPIGTINDRHINLDEEDYQKIISAINIK